MLNILKTTIAIAVGSLISLSTAGATDVSDFPNKAIRFVVPWNPGGAYDTIARLLGRELSDELGQNVVIENRPGAGSLVGTEVAASAKNDGYTIVLYGNNHAILPAVYKDMSFDVQKDFDPVALMGTMPGVLLVHPSVKATTVQELVDMAKDDPGALNYGSGGNGSSTHLAMERFKQTTDVDILHIPYKAGVPATMDLIAGETHVGLLDIVSARSHVESGDLRPLAATGASRSPFLPDVPTIAEAGYPDYEFIEWFGMTVPTGTPASIVNKLNKTLQTIFSKDEFAERVKSMGIEPRVTSPEDFGEFLKNEVNRNIEIAQRAGMTID